MAKKVLFITEGPVDELHLLKSICKDLGIISTDREFYSYCTDFHQFAKLLIPDENKKPDENMDIQLVLKSQEQDPELREILSKKYTDIYIVFDLDPHVRHTEYERINALLSFFTDSSDMGRLFINYPMMQSYKHLKTLPDIDFQDRKVSISEIKIYKKLVANEACGELIKTHDYNHIQLREIAYHHYCKREKILGREYTMNTASNYDVLEDVEIFTKEIQCLELYGYCDVLNTSVLIYFEYCPEKFLREIQTHKNRFRI